MEKIWVKPMCPIVVILCRGMLSIWGDFPAFRKCGKCEEKVRRLATARLYKVHTPPLQTRDFAHLPVVNKYCDGRQNHPQQNATTIHCEALRIFPMYTCLTFWLFRFDKIKTRSLYVYAGCDPQLFHNVNFVV